MEEIDGDPNEEEQIEELRKVAGEYRERFEGNPWIQNMLVSL